MAIPVQVDSKTYGVYGRLAIMEERRATRKAGRMLQLVASASACTDNFKVSLGHEVVLQSGKPDLSASTKLLSLLSTVFD